MAGLRCVQPQIRQKFFEVFDNSIRRRLNERLFYIACSQNWETIGPHFWIKQCIELLLVTAVDGTPIQSASPNVMLPSICSVIEQADAEERANFVMATAVKEKPMDVESVEIKEVCSTVIIKLNFSDILSYVVECHILLYFQIIVLM